MSGEHESWIDACVRAIQRGDDAERCARRLDRHYRPRIFAFFLRRVRDREDAKDLTQESLTRVFRGIDEYRFHASFDTWLFQIVKNSWRNDHRARSAQKRAAVEVPLEDATTSGDDEEREEVDRLATDGPSPEEAALAGERDRAVDAAVAQLPPGMRRCIQLRFGHGFRYREIAAVLRVSIDTVKSQLHDALRRLRPLLGDLPDPDEPEV